MLRKLSVVALSWQKMFYNLGMPRRFRKIRKQRKPVEAGSGRFWRRSVTLTPLEQPCLCPWVFWCGRLLLGSVLGTLPTFTVALLLIGIYLSF